MHSHGWLSEPTSTMGVDTVWELQSPVRFSGPDNWSIWREGVFCHSFGAQWSRPWANRVIHNAFLTHLGQFFGMYAETPRLGLSAALQILASSCLFALLSLHTQLCFHQLSKSQTVCSFSAGPVCILHFAFCILCISDLLFPVSLGLPGRSAQISDFSAFPFHFQP